jgi:hypothetical protein
VPRVIASLNPGHSLGNSSKLGSTHSCPGWDSNPHWTVFETASSTGWDTGATRHTLSPRKCAPREAPGGGPYSFIAAATVSVVVPPSSEMLTDSVIAALL